MTTRQELLQQWQQRLAEARSACRAATAPSWSDQVRVKLYRFLLAMYGQTEWPGAPDDVDNQLGRAQHAECVVAEPQEPLAGKEPRTRAQILQGLRNVKGLGEELAPAGPLTKGLQPDSPMIVASFKKQQRADVAMRKLRRNGFAPVVAQQGKLFQIYVAAACSTAAIACLQEPEPAERDYVVIRTKSRPGTEANPTFLLFCAFFFGSIGGLLLSYLVQLCWQALSTTRVEAIPRPEELIGVATATAFCLATAWLLFHSSANVWQSRNFSPALFWGLWHALVGGGFTLVVIVVATQRDHPYLADYQITPARISVLGGAAIICDVFAVALFWVWWKWRRITAVAK